MWLAEGPYGHVQGPVVPERYMGRGPGTLPSQPSLPQPASLSDPQRRLQNGPEVGRWSIRQVHKVAQNPAKVRQDMRILDMK